MSNGRLWVLPNICEAGVASGDTGTVCMIASKIRYADVIAGGTLWYRKNVCVSAAFPKKLKMQTNPEGLLQVIKSLERDLRGYVTSCLMPRQEPR